MRCGAAGGRRRQNRAKLAATTVLAGYWTVTVIQTVTVILTVTVTLTLALLPLSTTLHCSARRQRRHGPRLARPLCRLRRPECRKGRPDRERAALVDLPAARSVYLCCLLSVVCRCHLSISSPSPSTCLPRPLTATGRFRDSEVASESGKPALHQTNPPDPLTHSPTHSLPLSHSTQCCPAARALP